MSTPRSEPLNPSPSVSRGDDASRDGQHLRAVALEAPEPRKVEDARREPLSEPGAPPGRPAPAPDACGLRFERPGGPLVVVCGLHGGAGTSTLAYALGAQAARESPDGLILLCESDAAAGDIALLAGTASPYSLSELAAELQAQRQPAGFLARAGTLRVIAGAAAPAPSLDDGAIAGVLAAARRRHALTVVDAGTVRAPATRELLLAATHVIWILEQRPGAAARARGLLASPLVPALAARQLLAVRGQRRRHITGVQRRDLRRVAEDHCDRLVFLTDSPDVDGQRVELTDRRLRGALTALAGFLTRAGEA